MSTPYIRLSSNAHVYEVNGNWLTIKELMQLTGLKERGVRHRIKKGLPLTGSLKRGTKPMTLAFRGTQATIREIMAATGLSRGQVNKRHDGKRFFEHDEWKAQQFKDLPSNASLITYNGVTDTVAGWSRRVTCSRGRLEYRLDQGWPIERALFGSGAPLYRFRGKAQPIKAWADEYGVPRQTLYQRLNYWNWPIERALTEPSGKHEHAKRGQPSSE